LPPVLSVAVFAGVLWAGPAAPDAEAKVRALLEDACEMCHSGGGDATDPGDLDLSVAPHELIGRASVVNGKPLIVPGDPDASYLLAKMTEGAAMDGEIMPVGDPLPAEQLAVVREWIAALPAVDPTAPPPADAPAPAAAKADHGPKPFHGTTQIVLPSTTTLGKLNLQYRIDHRFGRIGTERGAFGLDGGATMSFGLAYGIFDGWDVSLRRTNSRKAWELATKYIPVRQEAGMPLSLGAYVSMDWLRDFDVANRVTGNFMFLISRLWKQRVSTMLTVSYHLGTDHSSRVFVDPRDGGDPVEVLDRRGTLDIGLASTVWLGARKRWGIDLEYILPVPDGQRPNVFYYHGGDADLSGANIGAWGLGGSYFTGRHMFQVFFTNNREIHPNLYAPGGQTANPFRTDEIVSRNPLYEMNFYFGFNLGRTFSLEPAAKRGKAKRSARKGGGA
jgi:hypothetical protein